MSWVNGRNEYRAVHGVSKIVVRFFDEGDFVTEFAARVDELVKKRRELIARLRKLHDKTSLSALFICKRAEWISRSLSDLKTERKSLAAKQLDAIVHTSQQLVVENERDYGFRPASKDELHELVEGAYAAHDVWLYVYKPHEDLAATRMESLYSFTLGF